MFISFMNRDVFMNPVYKCCTKGTQNMLNVHVYTFLWIKKNFEKKELTRENQKEILGCPVWKGKKSNILNFKPKT